MHIKQFRFIILVFLATNQVFWGGLTASATAIFHREIDHHYATQNGHKLYMDIFTPTGNAPPHFKPGDQGEGLGIVQVVSSSWHSDRGRFRPYEVAQFYNLLCARGYTVFALRPGDRDDFTLLDMHEHVRLGIRYVKAHAAQWGVDPDKLGLLGTSAGGHLAALAALDPVSANPSSRNPLLRHDSTVQAVALFFPPTDLLELEHDDFLSKAPAYQGLFFKEDEKPQSLSAINRRAQALSPLYHVQGEEPPFFIVHGDADRVVPVSQSRKLVAALEEVGSEVAYYEIRGVGHNWPTMPVQVLEMVNWFDGQLN